VLLNETPLVVDNNNKINNTEQGNLHINRYTYDVVASERIYYYDNGINYAMCYCIILLCFIFPRRRFQVTPLDEFKTNAHYINIILFYSTRCARKLILSTNKHDNIILYSINKYYIYVNTVLIFCLYLTFCISTNNYCFKC